MKFIVDQNVGKLARWLRMLGYDTQFYTGEEDWQMIITGLREGRVLLTRDSRVMKTGVVTNGRLKAIYIKSEKPEEQIKQVVEELGLDYRSGFLTVCIECNRQLEERSREQVEGRVPPYVFKTQDYFVECPSCKRVYWKGTHWQAMTEQLEKIIAGKDGKKEN
jgi:uncharacterized protein with PIN domain